MPTLVNYGAGLKDGKIKIAAGTVYDIDAIVSADSDTEQDEVVVKGDDEIKATFVMGMSEEITIVANAISFDVLQAITGNTQTSSASGVEVPLGTTSQDNPPFVEVQAFTTAKTSAGVAATIKKVWHKAQIYSVKTSQAGEQEFNVEMKARAYRTALDIAGAALSPSRITTLYVN